MSILDRITSPDQLKHLTRTELVQLAEDLRQEIIQTLSKTGGHLASSLGVIELTLALHKVLDSPKDKIIWDVGHQAYAHKLLTGRRDRFATLRQLDGLSGFPKRAESPHDCFDVGHSSTSVSAALGMAAARDARGGTEKVVAVIGDGSLTAGMAFEGFNHAGHLKKNLVVVLNDNEMSISPNVGALASFLSRKMTSDFFVRMKKEAHHFIGSMPKIGQDLLNIASRAEHSLKGFFTPGMLFEAFGFDYFGPINGHNLDELIETLQNVVKIDGPVLIHVVTHKGHGFKPAEEEPSKFHGVGPFDLETGVVAGGKGGTQSYTGIFGSTLVKMAEEDTRIVAITAAMLEGTGLKEFSERFPDRFFDVGIAEQHAVTFAAGMACNGMRPVVAIYSTFMQRAYDQVLHDVCLQKLPVTFAMDRGGLVGADGPTHHGVFDMSFMRHIPNLTFMVPRDELLLQQAMETARLHDGPFAYRYPRGSAQGLDLSGPLTPIEIGKGERLRSGSDVSILAVGSTIADAMQAAERLEAEGLSVGLIDPRFIKPLDADLLLEAAATGLVVTVEENALQGGFGSAVGELYAEAGIAPRLVCIGLPDKFIEQGTQAELRARCGLDADGIVRRIRDVMQASSGETSQAAS
jgi:1-deoxy-D-xylulose-5-phosphate synthase